MNLFTRLVTAEVVEDGLGVLFCFVGGVGVVQGAVSHIHC